MDDELLAKDQEAKTLAEQAWQAFQDGNLEEAGRLAEQAHARFARQPVHAEGVANTAFFLGNLAWQQGKLEVGLRFFEEAAVYYQDQPASPLTAQVFMALGPARQQAGRLPEAETAYRRALADYRTLDDGNGLANVAFQLGQLLRDRPEQALPYLEEATTVWNTTPPSWQTAYAFTALGDMRYQLGQLPPAAAAYERAADDFRRLDDKPALIDRLLDLGCTYRDLGQAQAAVTAYDEAITLAEATADGPRLGRALLSAAFVRQAHFQAYAEALADYLRVTEVGEPDDQALAWLQVAAIYQLQAKLDEAIGAAQRALAHYETANDRGAMAACQARIGDCYTDLHQFEAAEDAYRRALILHEQMNDPVGQVWTWEQLGALAWEIGQPEEALARYQRALTLAEAGEDWTNAAGCCEALATFYEILGQTAAATRFYEGAARYRGYVGDVPSQIRAAVARGYLTADQGHCPDALESLMGLLETAAAHRDLLLLTQLYMALSDVAARCGQPEIAVHYRETAVGQYEQLSLYPLAATHAVQLGQIYGEWGRLDTAEFWFRHTLDLCHQHRLDDWLATAGIGLAWVLFRRRHYDEARSELLVVQQHVTADNILAQYAIHVGLGVLAEHQGDEAGELAELQAATAVLDRYRLLFASPELPIPFWGDKARLYRRVVRQLARQGRSTEALLAAEAARSRSLLEWLGLAFLPPPAGVAPELVQQEQQWLQAARQALQTIQREPGDHLALSRLREMVQQIEQIWQAMGNTEYIRLRRGQPLVWAELRTCLRWEE